MLHKLFLSFIFCFIVLFGVLHVLCVLKIVVWIIVDYVIVIIYLIKEIVL